ncbi:helix-turn-helix domain-containing protein [Sphingopyxis sp. R3-92]|uniref:helix-turn-helix domain-containing protein n=1 Tax=Sphingopyxis sp. R3-92 TaxID=3158553 RepID=UPI003EE48CDE
MTQGFQALTEKEKEALRLLVQGYDAKSMARHLGRSVHTINERLRDARRKMAVSSSREAARQLREIEYPNPEFLGPTPLGDAEAAIGMKELQAPAPAPRLLRRYGWIVGGVFMSFSLALLALSSLSGTGQAPTAPQSAVPAAETATVRSVRSWFALVDAGDWDGSWNATGQSFKSLNTSDTWAEVSQSVRTPLGAVVSRALIGEENVPAPPYGYQVVKFRTSFAHKADAIETLSLARENESWRVVGYTIE